MKLIIIALIAALVAPLNMASGVHRKSSTRKIERIVRQERSDVVDIEPIVEEPKSCRLPAKARPLKAVARLLGRKQRG